MPEQKSDIEAMAAKLKAEVAENAPILAQRLFGDRPAGMRRLSRAQFVDYARRHWGEPLFRSDIRRQLGDEAFIALAEEVTTLPSAPVAAEGAPNGAR